MTCTCDGSRHGKRVHCWSELCRAARNRCNMEKFCNNFCCITGSNTLIGVKRSIGIWTDNPQLLGDAECRPIENRGCTSHIGEEWGTICIFDTIFLCVSVPECPDHSLYEYGARDGIGGTKRPVGISKNNPTNPHVLNGPESWINGRYIRKFLHTGKWQGVESQHNDQSSTR